MPFLGFFFFSYIHFLQQILSHILTHPARQLDATADIVLALVELKV